MASGGSTSTWPKSAYLLIKLFLARAPGDSRRAPPRASAGAALWLRRANLSGVLGSAPLHNGFGDAALGRPIRGGFEGVDLGGSASPSRGCVLSVFLAAAATTFAASTSWATAAASASGMAATSLLPAPGLAAFRGRGLGRARASRSRGSGRSGSSVFTVSVVVVSGRDLTVLTVLVSRSKRTSCRDGSACLAVSLGLAKTSPQGRRA
mmetsp:Transcript_43642/g.69274  ORF Transcript_43642/g.69274 Transcript_43642/m.69274 type:complete len:208 (-) Transcript_43642:232-855(-)